MGSYIVWLDGGMAYRRRDGRIEPSQKRMTMFSRREAVRIRDDRAKLGQNAVVRRATSSEVQWAQGGYRTGSDWNDDTTTREANHV